MSRMGSLVRRPQAALTSLASPEDRIRPEDLEEEAALPDGREHALSHRIIPMPLEVHEEHVLPRLPPGGSRLDLGQAQARRGEGLEDPIESAHLVADGEQD